MPENSSSNFKSLGCKWRWKWERISQKWALFFSIDSLRDISTKPQRHGPARLALLAWRAGITEKALILTTKNTKSTKVYTYYLTSLDRLSNPREAGCPDGIHRDKWESTWGRKEASLLSSSRASHSALKRSSYPHITLFLSLILYILWILSDEFEVLSIRVLRGLRVVCVCLRASAANFSMWTTQFGIFFPNL